ncbi:outer membrane lipoprotein carrier protein LolA [Sulfitobacter sp. 1151]|uniref:Outer membrane lipoprotein carrier protein LolA n=2 Tax=Parasulfitobacter algicola TaxID=2614809 RepID=A0ABX2IKK6_9RHOB|nr:outer membrane lipoprotein carrier protein LolA [Sulfitobacter algicola]NSX53416.1 outer membrane lipoprotein carrier protein LolA [Sulfitobacter algicola]
MKRIILLPLLWAVFALPAAAEKLSLNEISAYLNSFQTASGAFTQLNADGTIANGKVMIKRPGRARFEYEPPTKSLVIAGGGQVAIFDGKSNSNPSQYPLRRTPLNIILERNVNLGRAKMVVGHTFDGTATTVVAQDPENPQYGNIQLLFTANPVELRQWVITDENGFETKVILRDLETGVDIGARPFSIVVEAENWN